MRKPWKSIIGWMILSVVAITASQEILYKTVAHVGDRLTDRAIENGRRLQFQTQQILAKPSQTQSIAPTMTEAERLEMRRKEEFEKAFMADYGSPEECERWKSDRHMVECVNHQIRARKAFRQKYYADVELSQYIGDNWVR